MGWRRQPKQYGATPGVGLLHFITQSVRWLRPENRGEKGRAGAKEPISWREGEVRDEERVRGAIQKRKTKYIMGLVSYVKNSYNELVHKVTWPSFSELQSSALVVMIAALLIAAVVLVMDICFENIMQFIYRLLY